MHCQLERLFQGQDRPPPPPSSLDKIGCLPLHVLEGRSDECQQTVEISRDRIKVQVSCCGGDGCIKCSLAYSSNFVRFGSNYWCLKMESFMWASRVRISDDEEVEEEEEVEVASKTDQGVDLTNF
ncbi:hypothetical protein OIU74_004965 [Salix koriyanagi]|uniref:Uncharacterized protein n=1 Tax=Salix koriyanagi TaxID=2511006 RepID=A0A9Q0ZFZ3_9ROSI|nr:hypothetical protein OIU74_004965 [Salix koriyanagi]